MSHGVINSLYKQEVKITIETHYEPPAYVDGRTAPPGITIATADAMYRRDEPKYDKSTIVCACEDQAN